jgi:glucose uptake protein GlcU
MPFIYMHILSGEPEGTIGFGFFLIRMTSSAMYLISSSFLLVRFNWITNRNSEGKHEARAVFLLTILELICLSFAALDQPLVAACAAIFALAIGLFTSSTLLRELNFVRNGKSLLVKVVLDLLVSSVAAYALFVNPSVLGLFTVYLVSQVITIMISSWGLGFRNISVISLICLILCCVTLSLN